MAEEAISSTLIGASLRPLSLLFTTSRQLHRLLVHVLQKKHMMLYRIVTHFTAHTARCTSCMWQLGYRLPHPFFLF